MSGSSTLPLKLKREGGSMSEKITKKRHELKIAARTLNILIENLQMLIMDLENPTIIPSKLSVHYCQEVQHQLIEHRAKVFQKLELEA